MYYAEIQSKLPDSRDNRGKRHELAFVVVGFLTAILRSDKPLNLSVIHRSMVEDFGNLVRSLGLEVGPCISYSQLKRVLKGVDYESFNSINAAYFGKGVCLQGTEWKTLDGKELRGSIDTVSGQKRGQNIVNMVSHQDLQSSIIGYYDGSKSSEKVVVSEYLQAREVDKSCGNYTFDALHTSVGNLTLIARQGGYFLAQVKNNQRILLEDCRDIIFYQTPVFESKEAQKGHGRIDQRHYQAYRIDRQDLQPRWKQTQAVTLLVIRRKRLVLKTGKQSIETAYWITNQEVDDETFTELKEAIRKHWCVEVHHRYRDVQWGEDKMVTRNKQEAKVIAGFITVATNILQEQGPNMSQIREKLTKKWTRIYKCFKRK